MGLFNTLHHGRLAALQVGIDPQQEHFDYFEGGKGNTLEEAWEPFRFGDASEFVDMPPLAVFALLLVMFLFHIFAISSISKQILKSKWNFSLFMDSLCTIISPPLHCDWELLYRMSNEKDAITKCWKRYHPYF